MNITELIPTPTKKVAFRLSEAQRVPPVPGCYVLATFPSDILYIGRTVNLYVRFQQHRDDSDKTKPTLEGGAFWFYYLPWEVNDIDKLENTWLNDYEARNGRLPILNKRRAPVS